MLKQRLMYLLPVVACAGLLGYGYFLQYVQKLEPCPLCMVQRLFYYLVGGTLILAAIHGPGRVGRWIYGGFAALFALGGIVTAGRQVWLQHLPADQVPACGPDLGFMLDNFPLTQTISKLFAGSGECAKVDWTFLGLSIAEWSLAWFLALAAYAAWIALRRPAAAS
jgi:disulfide bond formation protein DsbB